MSFVEPSTSATAPVAASTSTTPSPWLDVSAAARRLGVSRSFVYTVIRQGSLRAAKLAGRRSLRIHVDWCDSFVRGAAEGGR
jgi:excisionase family DNA binding protein